MAAQAATQHWYKNGVSAVEGESVPIVMFGGETNLNPQNGLGGPNCGSVGEGSVENPVGGGAGVGRTNSFAFYECKAPECEAEVKAKTGLEGRFTMTFQNNSAATKEPAFSGGWSDALEESTVEGVSSIREKIGEPFVTYKTPSPPGMIRETEECMVASTQQVLAEAISEGELKPEIGVAKKGNTNGTSAAKPSSVRFEGRSTGVMHDKVAGEEYWFGGLKYLGYDNQELVTVKP